MNKIFGNTKVKNQSLKSRMFSRGSGSLEAIIDNTLFAVTFGVVKILSRVKKMFRKN